MACAAGRPGRAVGLLASARGVGRVSLASEEAVPMTIVMGLDQHRAQITAEWVDTETGEITRSRITPAHRQGVRQFCEKFRGQELEVALEATTGWRFVADELAQGRRGGASRRAGRDRRSPWEQEARQERSCRRAPCPGADDDRAAAGVLDPAGASAARTSWSSCRLECLLAEFVLWFGCVTRCRISASHPRSSRSRRRSNRGA